MKNWSRCRQYWQTYYRCWTRKVWF